MQPWYGVDLDSTLAYHDEHSTDDVIGRPLAPMVDMVKKWVSQGVKVKIMTARVNPTHYSSKAELRQVVQLIENWCLEHIGVVLEVTCSKDFYMLALFDDRAITVQKNTGRLFLP